MVSVTQVQPQITLEEFLERPETKPASEYIDGKIEQKPMPQGEHSVLQGRLVAAINPVASPQKLAYAFPELRCTFGGHSIVPDISVFTWDRIPKTEQGKIANRFEIHPDWVVEILSPEQSANQVIRKIIFCINQGTQLGWLIDPTDESVIIFQPNLFPDVKLGEEILPILEALQDLQLSAKEMFSWLRFE
ncbi:MAG: Uma2 family endonuclease [Cyanobacteria bacterium J06592_8]